MTNQTTSRKILKMEMNWTHYQQLQVKERRKRWHETHGRKEEGQTTQCVGSI